MVKVSVIIPIYNAEKYLQRCLDSVCNQTLKDIEIICVNDCSTDKSLDILHEYAKQDARIKIIDCKVNGGESKARNVGLDLASGEYIAFVDNDDCLDWDFYEKLYDKAKENNADISKGRVHVVGYDGKETFDDLNEKIRETNSLLFFAYYWWTAIYKASLIKDNNIRLPEGYPLGGDVLFLNQAVLACKAYVLCDDAFYHYYRREDSGDSKILSLEKVKSVLTIHEKIVDNINEKSETINDKQGVAFINYWCMMGCFNYAFRRKTLENLEFSVNKTFDIYNKISDKETLFDNLKDVYLCELDLLNAGDRQGLKNFYLENNTVPKMLSARLRYKMKKN